MKTAKKTAAKKTAKKATKPAAKPTKVANGKSLAALRCAALRHFGVDPFNRDQLVKVTGGKPAARGGRANIVQMAKAA